MTEYDYNNNVLFITCNGCAERAEFDGDFKYCISEAKTQGWIVNKKRGFDLHFCSSECKKNQEKSK